MLSILVEVGCNRYVKDECAHCHVYEPLIQTPKGEWHMTPEQAQVMADKIQNVEVLSLLAQQEINLTGGEASQNPHIVEIFKIFRAVSPNVCLHTNLDITSTESRRWQRLVDIMKLSGRIDITLYPTVWEKRQQPLLEEMLQLQDRLLVNVIYENLKNLLDQIDILHRWFKERGEPYQHAADLLNDYRTKINGLMDQGHARCRESDFSRHMAGIDTFTETRDFIFGINILPGFLVDAQGKRAMNSIPFPHDPYLLKCPAARGSIEIMTIQQTGEMTPCCDVGNLKCQPKFGNLLTDSPEQIMAQFEASRKTMMAGLIKNQTNMNESRAGVWVEEGVPPYCV